MSTEAKKQKILGAIARNGWFTMDIYLNEARELAAAGLIQRGERFSVGGNRKPVWVAA